MSPSSPPSPDDLPTEEFRAERVARHRSLPSLEWSDSSGRQTARVERRLIVGSGETADIVIADGSVSRLHAELDPREDGLWLRDLKSRNGTYLDTVMLDTAKLAHGSRIRFGRTNVTVSYEQAPTETIQTWPESFFGPLLGSTVVMRELFATLARVAAVDSSVLVQGETGTGKELVARAIHDASRRAKGPLVVVDCGALPESLLDAELFGHAKGAFTGAVAAREGAIEAAVGGTVFLDEIGELPLAMQPKLLRAMESKTIRRLGETQHRPVDVRFVAATHRDLLKMVGDREFREDLYFRLSVLPVRVPALRERADDIPQLTRKFLGSSADQFAPGFLHELSNRAWPGNVRELRNFVERALALGTTRALALSDENPVADLSGDVVSDDLYFHAYKTFREEWVARGELQYFKRLLERHGRNVREAAREADVNRTYIYRLIQRHGL
jgi:two-component system, NtrC family, response regulator GlrR